MSSKPRVALITGSSSGIGLAIATRLADAGHSVVLNSFEPEAAMTALADDLAARTGAIVGYVQADLAERDAGRKLVEETQAKFGAIDILVNNAGIQKVAPVEEFPPETWHRIVAISLDSTFDTIRTAIPGMYARGWGRIINVSSAHGLRASPFKSGYVSTKHGVIGLTKTVALEAAEKGVTVNAICPGYVWTPLVAAQLDDQVRVHGKNKDEVIRDVMLAPQPSKQFVQPEEIAEMALYLCGDMARSITGTSISIDGGWTAK